MAIVKYIHVTFKVVSIKKSCICMSIIYTQYLYRQYSCIHFMVVTNKLSYNPVPLVTHLLIPILMVLDVQTNNFASNQKSAWLVSFVSPYRLPMNTYIHNNSYKYEYHAEPRATCSTASSLHSFLPLMMVTTR